MKIIPNFNYSHYYLLRTILLKNINQKIIGGFKLIIKQ